MVGVDLAVCANNLRNQERLSLTANRQVNGRNCLELGGIWIDEAYKADMKTVVVKAQSDAYFEILEKHPEMKDVFRLGQPPGVGHPERHGPGRRPERRQGQADGRRDRGSVHPAKEVKKIEVIATRQIEKK